MIPLSHPARLALQSAEFFARYGAFGPFEFASPLLQLLLCAAHNGLGLDFASAATAVRLAAYAGGCAAVCAAARRLRSGGGAAAWAVAAYCAAPSRMHALMQGGAANELLFWSLAPVCALACDNFRRKPAPLRFLAAAVAALAWVCARAWSATLWDLAAFVEFFVIAAVLLYRPLQARRLAALPLLSFALVCAAAMTPPPRPPAANGSVRVAGTDDLRTRLNPVLSVASEKVFSASSTERAGEAILWARAMGAPVLWAPDRLRFADLLEPVAAGSALFALGGPVPGDAAIVSRRLWERLPAIRGVYDREALEQYLLWADRPESLHVRTTDRALSIRADLSDADAVLVRVPFAAGWELLSGSGRLFPDPVGYTVFAPQAGASGEMQIEIAPKRFRTVLPQPAPLHAGDFPAIASGGLVHGVKLTPPPFDAGDIVSIFGSGFLAGNTFLRVDGEPVAALYVGAAQINFKLPETLAPGRHELIVESGGLRSFPRSVEVQEQ